MLGKNIRYLRTQANYSQDKLAELLGYKSFTTIQKWESGVSNPPFSTVKKISELFHIDIDTLNSTDLSIHQKNEDFSLVLDENTSILIETYKSLSTESQKHLFEYAKNLKKIDNIS